MNRVNIALLLWFAVLATIAGGCAVTESGAFIRLQQEVETMKKEVAAVKSSAAPSISSGGDMTVRNNMADLSSSYDQLKSDMVAATTRVDDTRMQLQKETTRLNDRANEQGQAIQEMRAKVNRLEEIERRLAALEARAGSAASAPGQSSSPVPTEWKSPEEMYDYSLGLVKRGEYRKGREILTAFTGKYPDHRLLPNVLYWKGESFYAEKDYESAILSFQDVIDKYPTEDKASDAMYKQGLSFLGLRDKETDKARRKETEENAAFLFRQVQSKYPKSPAAGLARQKLSELK